MSEALAKIFNVEIPEQETSSLPVVVEPYSVEEQSPDKDNTEDTDFSYSRTNQYELIEQGKAALVTAMRIADQTENPRAIEVLSALLKTVSEMNKQLVVMSKDKAEVKNAKKGAGTAAPTSIGKVENAVFVGSAADLNKMLKEKKNV